jgi:hypothetical protein
MVTLRSPAVPVLVRGAIALAGAVAVLAASGCGGRTTTTASETLATDASTTASSTLSVPTHVFVMNSGRQRLVARSHTSRALIHSQAILS